jgi:amino acid transporter
MISGVAIMEEIPPPRINRESETYVIFVCSSKETVMFQSTNDVLRFVLLTYSESHLAHFEAIHSVQIGKDYSFGLDETLSETVANHQLLKSPPASLVPTTSSSNKQKYRVLGTLSLFGVCFMAMCAGPVGTEPLISTGGPLVGLIGIAVYVLLCQIPIAFMVTELCCAFPENGGFAVWAMAAFGPFWGFQVGYWAWIVSVINNAIFPGLIYYTTTQALGVEATFGFVAYLIKVSIAITLALPTYLGVRLIGIASLIMMTLVVIIIAIFSVWGLAVGDGAFFRLAETRTLNGSSIDDNVDWTSMITWLFVSFERIHWISMIAGEVQNPARTFPRVVFFSVMLGLLTYIAPFITAVIGDKTPWRGFYPAAYPEIARALGGPGLFSLVIFSSILGYVGLFANSMFLQSFLIQGMAQSRLLPRILRKRSKRFKTPKYGLLASVLAMTCALALPFETLFVMVNAFSCTVQAMIILSMLKLRRAFPYLQRPVRVPGNLATVTLMLSPPFGVFVYVIYSSLVQGKMALLAVAFVVPGFLFPFIRQWVTGHRICG